MSWKEKTVVFVLAAGLGTRLGSLTDLKPKALVEVNGMPLLEILLNKIKREGFKSCIINVHHFPDLIIDFVQKNSFFGLNIIISDESQQLLDTGGALIKILPEIRKSDYVLAHNVDIVSDVILTNFCEDALNKNVDAAMLLRDRKSSRKLIFDQQMQLQGWHHIEKDLIKRTSNFTLPAMEYAFSGIHFLKKNLLQGLDLKVCSIIDLYLNWAENHQIIGIVNNDGFWFDLGKQEEVDSIANYLRDLAK